MVKVTKICRVLLFINKSYFHCDVLDMDASHFLLGHPWQFDVNIKYGGKDNSRMFMWNGHKIALLPLNKMGSEKKTIKPTEQAQIEEEFVNEMKATRGLYVLNVKFLGTEKIEEDKKLKIVVPDKVQPQLAKFSKLVSENLPDNLPSMRDSQHLIN